MLREARRRRGRRVRPGRSCPERYSDPVAVDIEVLIVSYDSATVLTRCLDSLARIAPEARVAIREHADLAAFERTVVIAEQCANAVRVEHDPSNPGFGAGCNALAAGSDATFLVFLNPDTELVTWPWHERTPPERTIVGPVMIDSPDPSHHYGTSYRIRDEVARSWLRRKGKVPDGTGFVSGAALLIEAQAFRDLGGFDGGYFMYYEDIDLCTRGNAAGLATRLDADWRVRHFGAHSTKSRFGSALIWSYESARRFHAHQGSSPRLYSCYVAADGVGRAVLRAARRDRDGLQSYLGVVRRAVADLRRRDGRESRRPGRS